MDQDQDRQQSTPKQQLIERVKQATNVLVTVKSNPNVDELAALLGLTLMLNKLGKHATAVFSGQVPSTLEFLKPEETIETNTDSLRDFIVSLDKSKADKLRYKVEENVVKIFITPYRTSITQDDLEFSQGDFNIDVVIALGVTQRDELDNVITAHGRILHDATFIAVTAGQDHSELGQINWQEPGSSSLSEMLVSISEAFQSGLLDEQISTAFLTGIVAETDRFSNPKTTPKVMTMSAQLMASGANQQLIANELQKTVDVPLNQGDEPSIPAPQPEATSQDDTSVLSIDHNEEEKKLDEELAAGLGGDSTGSDVPGNEFADLMGSDESEVKPPSELETPKFVDEPPVPPAPESFNPLVGDQLSDSGASSPDTNTQGQLASTGSLDQPSNEPAADTQEMFLPPVNNGQENSHELGEGQIHIDHHGNLIRNATSPKHKVVQPLSSEELMGGDQAPAADPSSGAPEQTGGLPPMPEMDLTPTETAPDTTTLLDIEKSVQSPHLETGSSTGTVDSARDAVFSALNQSGDKPSADLPPAAPPEQAGYDAYRLPNSDTTDNSKPVTDVSGNLPPDNNPPQDGAQTDGSNISPPPVPPPMF